MFSNLLLAAQAAGIGVNLYANRQQLNYDKRGIELEESQQNLKMQQDTLAYQEQNLADLQTLNQTMASQRAIQGARGQMAGQGTTAAIENTSLRNYKSDERARKMSLSFREDYSKSIARLNRINYGSTKSELYTKTIGSAVNMFDFNKIFGGSHQSFGSSAGGRIGGGL